MKGRVYKMWNLKLIQISQDISQFENAEYSCWRCQPIFHETIHDFYVAMPKRNSDLWIRLKSKVAKLRSKCESFKELVNSKICKMGNVFISNHFPSHSKES